LTLNVPGSNYLSRDDIVWLFHDEQKYFKNVLMKVHIYEEQVKHHHDTEKVAWDVAEVSLKGPNDAFMNDMIVSTTVKGAEDLMLLESEMSEIADKKSSIPINISSKNVKKASSGNVSRNLKKVTQLENKVSICKSNQKKVPTRKESSKHVEDVEVDNSEKFDLKPK